MSPPFRQQGSAASPKARDSISDEQLTLEARAQRALDAARSIKVPRISEPGGWAYTPIIGPAWETAYDLQNGDYAGAAFNGAMLAAELTPLGPAAKTLKLVNAINKSRKTALLARAGTQTARVRKIEKVGKG